MSFVDLAGVDNLHIGDRHQLYARRSYRIEPRQKTAGQLRERKALVAVAKIVTSSQQIVCIEIVIDLANEAIHAVEEARGIGKIVAIRTAEIESAVRPQKLVRLRSHGGNIRSGIWIPRQERRDHWIWRSVHSLICRNLRRIGHAGGPGLCS